MFFITEKCRIHAACGVSQTPKYYILERGFFIMKKTIKLIDLDCANCAAKIENAVKKLDGVTDVTVSFMGQKMILETPDELFDSVLKEAKALIKKIEPDVTIKD